MTQNAQVVWKDVMWIGLAAAVLFLFALTIVLPHRPKVLPGSKGHREKDEETADEEIQPDGYIDSFAKEIEEAGGGLPPILKLALPGVLLWWLIYLLLNWTPR